MTSFRIRTTLRLVLAGFIFIFVSFGIGIGTASANEAAPGRKIKYYRNPMNPSIHSDHAMKDSMGMDYLPVYEGNPAPAATPDASDGEKIDRSSVTLSPEGMKLGGITEATVEKRDLVATARVPGRVLGGSRVSFQAFEQDLIFIQKGMEFEAESPSLPGRVLHGRITLIDSILDPTTRTARVDGVITGNVPFLRTEASLVGRLRMKIPGVLSIPEDAVLRTGDHDLVYVSNGQGAFSPRIVTLGVKAQGRFEVKSGLAEGEKVSAGPNFLLDSESKIELPND
jgi:hypothetical protein